LEIERWNLTSAQSGSVAVGRDNINSPILIGLDEEGVRIVLQQELVVFKAELARIAEDKGIPLPPLVAILSKLGEVAVSTEHIPALLEQKADELIALRTQLSRASNDRPEFDSARERALALVEEGDLDGARQQLTRAREAAREMREDTSRREAEFLSDEARIEHLQIRYQAAAALYAEAARLVAPFDLTSKRVDRRWCIRAK
jgi:hypothetical protein